MKAPPRRYRQPSPRAQRLADRALKQIAVECHGIRRRGVIDFVNPTACANATYEVATYSVWPYNSGMAIASIKATYTMDVETKRTLDRLAERWDVSRSEALRRAIRQAAGASAAASRLEALDALQRQLQLTPAAAARWGKAQRAERRRSSSRAEGRVR